VLKETKSIEFTTEIIAEIHTLPAWVSPQKKTEEPLGLEKTILQLRKKFTPFENVISFVTIFIFFISLLMSMYSKYRGKNSTVN